MFPRLADGRRSTTETARAVFADALRVTNSTAAQRAEAERRWRRNYIVHARQLVDEAVRAPQAVPAIAQAALGSLYARLQFVRGGETMPLGEAARSGSARAVLRERVVAGVSKAGPAPLAVPYRGQILSGDGLRRQLDRWEADGLVEPSFAQALWRVQAHPEWLDLADQRFALLGAQAEMAPLPWLLRWRAQVWAVDLPQAPIWQKLLRLAHAGNGALHVPLRDAADARAGDLAQQAGADLVRDLPEIAAWLRQMEGPLVVGAYAYLDGAQHVRVAAAMDAIQAQLAAERSDLMLAMLATPTDAYAVPAEPLQAAHAAFDRRRAAARLGAALTLGRAFARNGQLQDAGGIGGIVDALVIQQGPNYTLAKRLQQWRALAARHAGTPVSIHVAPPALTGSVLHNRLIAAAYRAAGRFGAQAFEPPTAAALMAALLVHDLRHPEAAANPATALAHPLRLLSEAACHGGLWRMPFAARSVLPAAALLGLLRSK